MAGYVVCTYGKRIYLSTYLIEHRRCDASNFVVFRSGKGAGGRLKPLRGTSFARRLAGRRVRAAWRAAVE
jgi:hypothetical protein